MRHQMGMAMIAGAIGLMQPAALAAQDVEADIPPAPLSVEQPEKGRSYYVATAETYQAYGEGLIGAQHLFRRAINTIDAHKVLRLTDLAISSRFESKEQPVLGTRVLLDVGENGRVVGCRKVDRGKFDPKLVLQICPVLKARLLFKPALGLDGKPAPDKFEFFLGFEHRRQYRDQVQLAFQRLYPSPTVDSGPDLTRPKNWPPLKFRRLSLYYGYSKRPYPSIGPYRIKSAKEMVTGVGVSSQKEKDQECVVVAPSGYEGFDSAACEFLVAKHGPLLSAPAYGKNTLPFLVIGTSRPERVIAPSRELGSFPMIVESTSLVAAEAIDTLAGQTGGDPHGLWMVFPIDEQGKPTDCRISRTSGSDKLDMGACQILIERLRYTPAVDVFGRPASVGSLRWGPSRNR